MTDSDRLQAIKARRAAMHCMLGRSHWEWAPSLQYPHVSSQFDGLFAYNEDKTARVNILSAPSMDVEINPEDAAFISNAPADVDFLLVALDAANAEIAALRRDRDDLLSAQTDMENELRRITDANTR